MRDYFASIFSSSPAESLTRASSPAIVVKNTTGYASEAKSSIIAIGLTIHNCPVEIREKMAVPEDKWEHAVAQLCSFTHVADAGSRSPCNRIGIYVVGLSFPSGDREAE